MEQIDFIPGYETRCANEIRACAKRMETVEGIAHAMKARAYEETLAELVAKLLEADSNEAVRLALSIFTLAVARQEH
jgi:hypothetical protein